jgi:hypothetical protein
MRRIGMRIVVPVALACLTLGCAHSGPGLPAAPTKQPTGRVVSLEVCGSAVRLAKDGLFVTTRYDHHWGDTNEAPRAWVRVENGADQSRRVRVVEVRQCGQVQCSMDKPGLEATERTLAPREATVYVVEAPMRWVYGGAEGVTVAFDVSIDGDAAGCVDVATWLGIAAKDEGQP